jgi:hypothetical protein
MSFKTIPPNVWNDYNTQRDRRYRYIPKLIAVSQSYLKNHSREIYRITETIERSKQLGRMGFALLGEQFETEKKLSHEIRGIIALCKHHHALLLKNSYMDVEHELLDADAHMHALTALLIGSHKQRTTF